ncbi:MAG: hypothetical protein SPI34_04245 [Opitutales bacterium]|nr:hypothetical protein [Opitutales bacterium]
METQSSELLGLALTAATALLGAYYLALKIRDMQSEKPDPKITYVTYTNMEKMRNELMRIITESGGELRLLRAEIREDIRLMQRQYAQSLGETRELISKNAQNISALVAQSALANQRIGELGVRVEKIAAKAAK